MGYTPNTSSFAGSVPTVVIGYPALNSFFVMTAKSSSIQMAQPCEEVCLLPDYILAIVHTNHDPQLSNPNQVMVIMFSVELGAVDESHRHLKPFMKGRGLLQFR